MSELRSKGQEKRSKVSFSKLTFHRLNWLEWISIAVGVWFLCFPRPYDILFTVLLCLPIVGLLLNGLNGRPSIASLVTVKKDEKGKDKYDVADFIDFPSWILMLRILIDFEFESFYSLILPGTIGFVLMLALLFITHRDLVQGTRSRPWVYSSLIFNVFLYSYAGTYGANCVYDDSKPEVYEARVTDKRIHKGRKGRRTYYVEVTPWGHHYDKEEIKVPNEQYDEIRIGETVKIDLREGLFDIPWYYIERKH